MSQPTQWVVVDNTDPSITYSPADGWAPQVVNLSHLTNLLVPVPPLYGTFQQYQPSTVNGTLTFNFTGGGLVANFLSTNISAIRSCTLDGQPLAIQQLAPTTQCTNNNTIQHGSHIFVVTAIPNQLLLFDYISYDPVEEDISITNVDVMYGFADPSINLPTDTGASVFPGDSLDFTFVGYSLGVYGSFVINNSLAEIPHPVSYSIDGNVPVNFAITNPTSRLTPMIESMIVLQTPRYSLGQHHLHLDFWGNISTTILFISHIIVQNMTTPLVLLDSFPTTLSPSPSATTTPSIVPIIPTVPTVPSIPAVSSVSAVSSTRTGPTIGGATAGATILVLIFLTFFIYRWRRLSVSTLFGVADNSNINPVMEPFQQQHSAVRPRSGKNRGNEGQNNSINDETHDVEPNLLIEPFNHWRTHVRGRHTEPTPMDTRNVEPNPAAPIVVQRPLRYRIHEDSGDQITQPDEGTVIVDLPPMYTTIGFTMPPAPPPNEQPLETGDECEANGDIDIDDPCNTITAQC